MLRNLVTLGTGELVARVMHTISFVLLARSLGKDAFGHLGLATAITSYALLFVMQGFDPIAMREVSQARADLKGYAARILGFRLVLALVMCLAVSAYVALTDVSSVPNRILLVLCVSYVANALTPRWSFLAIERSRPLAVASFLAQLCLLVAACLIRSPDQVLWAAGAQVLGEAAAALLLLWMLVSQTGGLLPIFDRPFASRLARHSWPVTLSLLLGNVMYNCDVVLLGAMGRQAEVGVYLACYRCVTVFAPFMGAFQAAVFPSLARSFPDFDPIRSRLRWLVLGAVVPLLAASIVLALNASWVLTLLFGAQYAEGAAILQLLIWVLPLQGFRILLRQLLVAFHLQHVDTRNISLGVLTNVVMDLVLIPRLGAFGCAVSTLTSEAVFCALTGLAVRRRVMRARGEPEDEQQ